MKILVDINNKILKVLENDRSIFKGEQSADKLILYINQQLVNEYPVITGLLSNGRRIGPFTTDSSYGTETIDGTNYTTAEFTLSKENGFTLTEGNTQVTIWIYKTKDTEVVSKTAIGNVTFNVVNTTSFNDGDIIISGDVEGTVVNIKVELENLQSSVNAVNSRVNNLNGVVVKKIDSDISTNKTLQELYDEYGSCFVGKVGYAQRNVLFLFYTSTTQTNLTVCHGSNLKTYENVDMNLNVASLLTDSTGNPTYSNSYTDKEIDELIANLKSSKVSIYMPSYSVGQGDEVKIRQRLTYDILTQPYTSSIIVAGGKYIAYLYIKGGSIKQVKLFDFISNTYYETSDIDTSNLTDYNTISFSTKSYYDKGKIDSLMLQKADKSTTYTKTEVDDKEYDLNQRIDDTYMELESMIEESRNEIEDRENLISIIGNATESLAGVMSTEDKKNLNTLVALLQDNENNITDTITEVLAIFNQYPEGADLVATLATKADKSDTYSKAETDNLLAGKANKADTYTKTEVDEKVAGAGGESLVIDMGTYTNDSNEEALKELFVSIKNKALPITTNYIYTAKVNGFKVKGMFNNISLKLDTNLQENDAEVKYEVYYDDEDNLLVNKWFVPIYSETNSFTIYGGDAYFSVSPDDHFIEFYSEYGNFILSNIGMAGGDSQGNSYDIEWRDLYRSLGQTYLESLYASDSYDGIFVFPLTYCASSLDVIHITVSKAGTNEVHGYLWEPGSGSIWKEDTKEFIPLIDAFTIGGLVDSEGLASVPNDIAFILGDYIAEGDEVEIEYIGNKFSPMVIM